MEEQKASSRVALWIAEVLKPVFEKLSRDIEKEGYQVSIDDQNDLELKLGFTKQGKDYAYNLGCTIRPTSAPKWPDGHIDLDGTYRIDNGEVRFKFRTNGADYDIEEVGDREIESHFYRTFRFLFHR